jgi:hypothetical protein
VRSGRAQQRLEAALRDSEKRKVKAEVANLKARMEKEQMAALKNAMAARQRTVDKENRSSKLPELVPRTSEPVLSTSCQKKCTLIFLGLPLEVSAGEETAEELQVDVEALLALLNKTLGKALGKFLDRHNRTLNLHSAEAAVRDAGEVARELQPGKRGAWLDGMASGLTSHQAVTEMRAFLRTEYTEKKEQTKDSAGDYRIPTRRASESGSACWDPSAIPLLCRLPKRLTTRT